MLVLYRAVLIPNPRVVTLMGSFGVSEGHEGIRSLRKIVITHTSNRKAPVFRSKSLEFITCQYQ